ncbi:cohesin subunit SA-1 [Drosophila elegans]|uniref:cohesin subunit SA-1 n=1 Tax=Drosophila elegans TaxID=30023 RepID=UPI001BC849D4|nr:cohesin subunit SA-1 [Drosophila elegans]
MSNLREMDLSDSKVAEQQTSYQNDESSGENAEPAPPNTLLQCVLDNNQQHEKLTSRWVNFYMESPTAALLELMQFVVEASGSHYQIPKDSPMPFSYKDILMASTAKFQSVSMYYPLIMKKAKSFASNVIGFIEALLKALGATPSILDNMFLGEFTGFLIACSECTIRPFRHTGTMIGLKMMTILSDLNSVEGGSLGTLWMRMFNSLFLDRRQDVVNDIRLLCLHELGEWFSRYPNCHLHPHRLRFFFEALQDCSVEVKQCCLENILRLSLYEDLRPMCLELGGEFSEQLRTIAVDRENEMGVQSLRILTDCYGSSPEILNDTDFRMLEQLMLASNRGLAQAAAKLFIMRRMETEGDCFSRKIRPLLEFFVDESQHEHAAYLVDSLLEDCETVLNWEPMIEMLMQDQDPNLTEVESSALIEILSKGVKQAITGEIPPGRYTEDLKREPMPGAQEKATRLLAPVFHDLLDKYDKRSGDLENLLELPQHFSLEYYQQDDKLGELHKLMDQIETIIFVHIENRVLRTAAHTLEVLHEIPSTRAHIKQLLNNAVTNYRIALRSWQASYGMPNFSPSSTSSFASSSSKKSPQSRARRLLNTLRLVSALYGRFNLSVWKLTESVLSSLKRVIREQERPGKDALPTEAVGLYLEVAYFSLNWDLKSFRVEAADNQRMEETAASLKKHLEDFLFVTFEQVVSECNLPVAYNSFSFICDLFVLYGDQLRESTNFWVRSLMYQPSLNEIELLEMSVLRNILNCSPLEIMKENNFDQLQDMRRLVASYCKLVVFNVFPVMRASKVFQYYEKYNAPFGDIMRSSMELALNNNSVNFGMTVLHTCLLPYEKILKDNNGEVLRSFRSTEFSELISLAKRLAETFNSNLVENRHGVIALHTAGIMYVMESVHDEPTTDAPKNLLFLRVIQEFAPQVLAQDRVTLLQMLQPIEQPTLPSCRSEEWQPLEGYLSALNQSSKPTRRRDSSVLA